MIACEVCGGNFFRITASHLKKHDMTMKEYRDKYPTAPLAGLTIRRNLSQKIKLTWTPERKAHASKTTCFRDPKIIELIRQKALGRKRPDVLGDKNPAKRPEVRAKISKKAKGKPHPWARGERNPLRNPETVEKFKNTRRAKYNGGWYSEEGLKVITENLPKDQRGENHPCWEGGISFEPYGLEFNNELKTRVRKRDGFSCQLCGAHQDELGQKLDVHHIDYDKQNSSPENLISLCMSCHSKTNHNKSFWTGYFWGQANV